MRRYGALTRDRVSFVVSSVCGKLFRGVLVCFASSADPNFANRASQESRQQEDGSSLGALHMHTQSYDDSSLFAIQIDTHKLMKIIHLKQSLDY